MSRDSILILKVYENGSAGVRMLVVATILHDTSHCFLSVLWPSSLDNCLCCEQCNFTHTHKSGPPGRRSHGDTCRQGDIWSSHEEYNERAEQFSLRGPSQQKPKPFSPAPFTLVGKNISCMQIFTGQQWPHGVVGVLAHSQRPEIISHADVLLALRDAA